MATKKAGGSAKNLRDSGPKYLGVKRGDGAQVGVGDIIVRQRGTRIRAGRNVGLGRDHTLFARSAGTVSFQSMRRIRFDGRTIHTRRAVVLPAEKTDRHSP